MHLMTESQKAHLASIVQLGGSITTIKWTWTHDNKLHKINRITLKSLIKLALISTTGWEPTDNPNQWKQTYTLTDAGKRAAQCHR